MRELLSLPVPPAELLARRCLGKLGGKNPSAYRCALMGNTRNQSLIAAGAGTRPGTAAVAGAFEGQLFYLPELLELRSHIVHYTPPLALISPIHNIINTALA